MLKRIPWPVAVLIALIAVVAAALQIADSASYGRPRGHVVGGPPQAPPGTGRSAQQPERSAEGATRSGKTPGAAPSKSGNAPSSKRDAEKPK